MSRRVPTDADICPVCAGNGWILQERSCAEYDTPLDFAIPCEKCNSTGRIRYKPGEIDTLRTRAKIPSRFKGIYLDQVDWRAWQTDFSDGEMCIKDFVKNFREWQRKPCGLYLTSRTKGSGKTYIASAIGNELLRLGKKVIFLPATDILRAVTDKGDSSRGEVTLWDRIRTCEVLILDDLGSKQSGGKWHADEVLNLIDHRYSNNLVTILTTNERICELKFDERLISRLFESCLELPFPEYSIRVAQAKEKRQGFLEEIKRRNIRR